MKHDDLLAGLRKLLVAAGLATLGSSVLVIPVSIAQSSANCRAYAEDYSLRYSTPGQGRLSESGDVAPALVRWRPIGPAPFSGLRSLTARMHAACAAAGRKGAAKLAELVTTL